MKNSCFSILFFFVALSLEAQLPVSLDTIKAPKDYANIYTRVIASDSLSSSFVIFIKKEVKKHRHVHHTENVYIIEGSAEMQLGDQVLQVKKGDIIFIPKNTVHSVIVKSPVPLKVLSIQSPHFDGSDRVLAEE